MNEKMIQPIMDGESTLEPHGYDVHNINERLRLNYGSEYGLTLQSMKRKLTVAVIHMPVKMTSHVSAKS